MVKNLIGIGHLYYSPADIKCATLCRVLVHAAAGGVGLAALQTLAAMGVSLPLATAGSPAKRALLR